MYELCESVSVMKGDRESRIGMMLDFSWMIPAKSYVQITKSMFTVSSTECILVLTAIFMLWFNFTLDC